MQRVVGLSVSLMIITTTVILYPGASLPVVIRTEMAGAGNMVAVAVLS